MKKRILLGASALVVVALLAAFGPDLLDLYRLQRYIDTSAEANQADGGPWPRVTDACTACHGVDGNSQHQGYPSLAGQPAPYVADQLRRFASGQRVNPNMGPLAMTMSDAEMKLVADHFAKRSVAENKSFEPDPALREKGQQLVASGACAACHGERLMGREQFPRLAGQGSDYLVTQLDAYAAGTRSDPTAPAAKAEERSHQAGDHASGAVPAMAYKAYLARRMVKSSRGPLLSKQRDLVGLLVG